jgi:hypothetical protein
MTGAEGTAAAIRKSLDASGKNDVGITAELGCSTPWLVVPGVRIAAFTDWHISCAL